jgi:hypothetical protein
MWSDPAGILSHLGKAIKQGAPPIDLSPQRNIDEAALFGSGFTGGASGFIPGMRDITQRAAQDITDPQTRMALQGAGYFFGPGKLGIASRIGTAVKPALGSWGGGILGSMLEGGGSSALSTAGAGGDSGDTIGSGILGTLTGGLLGSFGGVTGRGGKLPPEVPEATLQANKDAAAKVMRDTLYDNADIRQATTRALGHISASPQAVTDTGANAIGKLNAFGMKTIGKGVTSAEDLNRMVKGLTQKATKDVSPEAGQIAQAHFNDLLQNTAPISSPIGGTGAQAISDFNNAFGRLTDTKRLSDMAYEAGLPGGKDVGTQMGQFLRTDEGQRLMKSGAISPSTADALKTLAETARPSQTSAAPSAWDLRHMLHPILGAAVTGAAGAGGEYAATGQFDPWHLAGEVGTGALLGYGLHRGIPAIQGRYQQANQDRALAAARVAASTGLAQAPVLPAATIRDALRRLIFSYRASAY